MTTTVKFEVHGNYQAEVFHKVGGELRTGFTVRPGDTWSINVVPGGSNTFEINESKLPEEERDPAGGIPPDGFSAQQGADKAKEAE